MKRLATLLTALALAALLMPRASAHAQGTGSVFLQNLRAAEGVLTDASGYVYVTSDTNSGILVTKWDSLGRPVAHNLIGNFFSVGEIGHLVQDPGTGNILELSNTGNVYVMRPNLCGFGPGCQIVRAFNVGQLRTDTLHIWDVQIGKIHPSLGGMILPQFASYGDIALLRRGSQLDVFIAGMSQAQAFPFVMRVRLTPSGYDSKVLVASSTGSPNNQTARGIAVNSRGTVLTTLPVYLAGDHYGIPDRAISFSADFDYLHQSAPGIRTPFIVSRSDLSSRGMATDAAGNFYVATGSIGSSQCGAYGSGALVVMTAALHFAGCNTFRATVVNSQDVAVSGNGRTAYETLANYAAVVKWVLQPPSGS